MEKNKIDLLNKHFPLKVIGTPGFWTKFTPMWFQFMGWILAIGAINAIYKITSNKSLNIVLAISYVALAFYIYDRLSSLQFDFIIIKNEKAAKIVSIVLSTVFTIFIWLFVSSVIKNIGIKCLAMQ